ncbi:hypothetical protein [Halorientalis halophila]|uniref:hypothetical protein n=1 Tax=Halorientalis halophila TaxID=3108499 RepID=UPI00300BCF70
MALRPGRTTEDGGTDVGLWRHLGHARTIGTSAFVGLAVVYLVLFVGFVVRLLAAAGSALGLGDPFFGVSPVGAAAGLGGLLVALALLLLVGVFLVGFFAVFVFVTLHAAEVELVLASTASPSIGFFGVLPLSPTVTETGIAPITPAALTVPFSELGLLLPPLLLCWYGFRIGGDVSDLRALVRTSLALVVGYGTVTLVVVLGTTWLFNLFVADLVVRLFSLTPAVDSVALTVQLPDFRRTLVRMCLGYPLLFGGTGTLAGALVERLDDDGDGNEAD